MRAEVYEHVHASGVPAERGDPLRVVYVAGSGHTGSTLLAMMADSHPEVASVGEVAVKPRIRRRGDAGVQKCSCGARIGRCTFWNEVFRRVQGQGFQLGPENWSNDYRFDHPLLHRLLTRETSHPYLLHVRSWAERFWSFHRRRTRHIDRVNVAFVRSVLATTGASVFCDTTKGSSRLARLLAIPDFDVRIVTLVRDARGYVASAKRRGKRTSDAAETWRKDQLSIRALTQVLPSDRRMLVRYEDLCTDLSGTLERFWDFCGVPRIPTPTRVLSEEHHVLGNNMRMAGAIEVKLDHRWQRELDEGEQSAVLQIAGRLNREFGYDG